MVSVYGSGKCRSECRYQKCACPFRLTYLGKIDTSLHGLGNIQGFFLQCFTFFCESQKKCPLIVFRSDPRDVSLLVKSSARSSFAVFLVITCYPPYCSASYCSSIALLIKNIRLIHSLPELRMCPDIRSNNPHISCFHITSLP